MAPDRLVREYGRSAALTWGMVFRYCKMPEGVCFAAQARIGDRIQLDRTTVNQYLGILVGDHWLALGPHREETDTNVYSIPPGVYQRLRENQDGGVL